MKSRTMRESAPKQRISGIYLRGVMTAGTAISTSWDAICARVTAERTAQGLPATIADPATLAAVDDLLLNLPHASRGSA
jgi:hypothetical protein